jgi:tRNA(Leu) C34 or U34 (ribose-2'-O)-methylase TrmL
MSQLSIQDVNSAIMFGSFTNEQLNSIASAIKYRRAQVTKENKRSIVLGDVVKFVNPRSGRTHQGSVVKINIKEQMESLNVASATAIALYELCN